MVRSTIFINLLICIYCLIHCSAGAAYGGDCSSSPCMPDTYQICDNSMKICVCDTGYSENDAGNGCIADELGMGCNTNVGCADTAAICTNYICACDATAHYDSNGGAFGGTCIPRIALGVECPESSSINLLASDLCSDPNSECKLESSTSLYKCLCGTGFSNTGGQCVQSVDGVWTDWTSWTNCSVTCGGGSQSRSRSCNNPAPANGGSNCTGDSTKSQGCNDQPCPIDGGWTAWSAWSACSVTCDGGSQSRSRSCTNPAPEHNGSDCTGVSTKSQDCNTVKCPVVPHGGQCTIGGDKCAGNNIECNGGTCQCVSGNYWNNDACVAKVSLGAVCPSTVSSTAPCTDTHATCQQDGLTSTYRCRCTGDYYDSNGNNNNGGQCTRKKLLGATCPTPNNPVPDTESCSDTNARCKWNNGNPKCLCRDGYYDNDGTSNIGGTCTLKGQLDNACPAPTDNVPATVTCIDSVATCVDDGNGYKCKCPSDYYDNNGNTAGGQCVQKVSLGAECTNPTNTGVSSTAPCTDAHATCQQEGTSGTYKCRCTSDYYDSNGNSTDDGKCSPKVDLGDRCPMVDACKTHNSQCVSEKCICHGDFYDSNTESTQGGGCIYKRNLGDACQDSSAYNKNQCMDPKATCDSSKICSCNNGYHKEGSSCVAIPQKPTSVSITDLTSTSFTVSWSIDGPRPGQTTFHVEITADMPAMSTSKLIIGFYNRSIEVTGLEEYWNYVVKVIASTSVGSIASDTKNVTTNSAAPGRVSEFTITPHPGGIYTQMKLSWKSPPLLEMNGVIKEYHFVYNATKTTSLTTEMYSHHKDMNHIYETMLLVDPETYYYFKVIAVNMQNENGEVSEKIVMSPAGIPPNYIEKDEDIVKHVTDMRQNSFTVTLIRGFFSQNEFGVIRTTGLMACKTDNCNFKNSLSLSEFNAMPTWQNSASDGYPTYRITKQDWMDNRSLSDISFTVGSEDCTGVADDVYCNGPLAPGSSYMIIAAVCTNGGCLLSNSYGPFTTLEELKCKECSTDKKAIIVGVVLGLIILLLIGYIGYLTLRLRRANLNQEQSRTSPSANTQPTYVNQMFENVAMPSNNVEDNDNPENAYTSLNDETRAEKSTYELI